MNAAFVLVTAGWLAGADMVAPTSTMPSASPAPVVMPVPAQGPISSAPVMTHSSGASYSTEYVAEPEKKKGFCARLRAMFGHKDHDEAPPVHYHGGTVSHQKVAGGNSCPCAAQSGYIQPHAVSGTVVTPGTVTSGPVITTGPVATQMPPAEKINVPQEESMPMPPRATQMPAASELAPPATHTTDSENTHPFDLSRRYETRVERAADFSSITGQLFYVHADGGLWVLRYAPVGKEDPNGGGVLLARDHDMNNYREGDLVTVKGEILNEQRSLYLGAPLYRAKTIQLLDRQE